MPPTTGPAKAARGLLHAFAVERGKAVNDGDLAGLEGILTAQAVALNAVFSELARRGFTTLGHRLDAADGYIRLALRAQSQFRASVETLALMKNPPVFARHANINNGGQQQINNGVTGTRDKARRDGITPLTIPPSLAHLPS